MCIAVVAVLVGLLLPLLSHARSAGYQAVCATNLRQLGIGWASYLQNNKETLPSLPGLTEYHYGGCEFVGSQERPVLAMDRPINRFIAEEAESESSDLALLFRCPADKGVWARGTQTGGTPHGTLFEGRTLFRQFGNSYRANPYLLNSTAAGIDTLSRPLSLRELAQVDNSRLLLTGDTTWWYATRAPSLPDAQYEASWHGKPDSGNMLAVDGSTRFVEFSRGTQGGFTLAPRPELEFNVTGDVPGNIPAPLPPGQYLLPTGTPRPR